MPNKTWITLEVRQIHTGKLEIFLSKNRFGLIFIQSYNILFTRGLCYTSLVNHAVSLARVYLGLLQDEKIQLYSMLKTIDGHRQITLETMVISMAYWFIKQTGTKQFSLTK